MSFSSVSQGWDTILGLSATYREERREEHIHPDGRLGSPIVVQPGDEAQRAGLVQDRQAPRSDLHQVERGAQLPDGPDPGGAPAPAAVVVLLILMPLSLDVHPWRQFRFRADCRGRRLTRRQLSYSEQTSAKPLAGTDYGGGQETRAGLASLAVADVIMLKNRGLEETSTLRLHVSGPGPAVRARHSHPTTVDEG